MKPKLTADTLMSFLIKVGLVAWDTEFTRQQVNNLLSTLSSGRFLVDTEDGCEQFEDFICICDEEGKKEAAELMHEVKAGLVGGKEFIRDSGLTDANFVTAVVQSLNWDFEASITDIGNDQWSGVGAESYDKSFRTWIQCDRVEHGIAATWKAFADREKARKALVQESDS